MERTHDEYGSQLVVMVQRVVGALEPVYRKRSLDARAFSLRTRQRARLLNARSVDGHMGPQTVCCLRAWQTRVASAAVRWTGSLGFGRQWRCRGPLTRERGRDGLKGIDDFELVCFLTVRPC